MIIDISRQKAIEHLSNAGYYVCANEVMGLYRIEIFKHDNWKLLFLVTHLYPIGDNEWGEHDNVEIYLSSAISQNENDLYPLLTGQIKPVRQWAEIKKFHDILIAVIKGTIPTMFDQREFEDLACVQSALCWVLQCTHKDLGGAELTEMYNQFSESLNAIFNPQQNEERKETNNK